MTRRHSDAASFEVIGLVSYGKTSNAPTSSQVGRNAGYAVRHDSRSSKRSGEAAPATSVTIAYRLPAVPYSSSVNGKEHW